jgi:hypothetical protein
MEQAACAREATAATHSWERMRAVPAQLLPTFPAAITACMPSSCSSKGTNSLSCVMS